MADKITVFVNGAAVSIYRGMAVKHALIAYDYAIYKAAEEGDIVIEDERGFRIGLGGALHPGAKIFVKKTNA